MEQVQQELGFPITAQNHLSLQLEEGKTRVQIL